MSAKLLVKRSTVSGATPNTSALLVGELALNLADGILYSTNGSIVFEIGANLSSLSVNSLSFPATDGNPNQFITTDGAGNLSFANSIIANNGIIANSSGVFVDGGTGVTVNASGVHIGQDVSPGANVEFAYVTANGTNITSVDAATLNGNSVNDILVSAALQSDNAYSNAVAYASNADNITSGTLSGSILQVNNGIIGNSSGVFVNGGTGVTVNATGVHIGQDVSNTSNVFFHSVETSGDVSIGGNLTVTGNTVTLSTVSLAVKDNLIYMNQGIAANITNIQLAGNLTHLIFTADNNFANGWDVSVSGVTPTSFNGEYQNITVANATHFIVANTNSDTYVSGGIARGKTDSNPDLGWAGGYNDGTYAHAGMFRDATDNTFKVFTGYTLEPDSSVFIDTGHVSFSLADFQANLITAVAFSGNTANVSSLTTVDATVTSNLSVTSLKDSSDRVFKVYDENGTVVWG